MKYNPRYTLRHLSVRVPWHDNAWNGTICQNPKANSACLILKSCALGRDDEKEEQLAGKSLKDLEEDNYPACQGERATFMAPFQIHKTAIHPYTKSSPSTHGHLKPTRITFPQFSAAAVPYHWLLNANASEKAEFYDLNYDEKREPQLDWGGKNIWIQEEHNQKAFFNCFFQHLEETKSLIFIYAKQVPFVEESGRVLVGVGSINKIIPSNSYEGSNSRFGAVYWEHMVLHSIREDAKNGFLLPYHEGLAHQKKQPEFDMAEIAVVVPDDKRFEFSYAAEHVSNDSAIRILLDCVKALEIAQEHGFGKYNERKIQWIHDEVARLEQLRGIYPGMGAALCALGIAKGHFVAAEIINQLKDKSENPWHLFEKAIKDPKGILSEETEKLIPNNTKKVYEILKNETNPQRIQFLHLLSRFDLSIEQAQTLFVEENRERVYIERNDREYLANPYLIYEDLRFTEMPVAISTLDLGLYLKNAPDNLLPSQLVYTDPFEVYRIRALTIEQLEKGVFLGHTLLPRKEIIRQIIKSPLIPDCKNLNSDYFKLAENDFEGEIEITEMKNGDTAYQLQRFAECKRIISKKISDRIGAKRLTLAADWEKLLDNALNPFTKGEIDEQEAKARKEKVAALKEIAESRFSVLIGPAGTGKTTLLTILAGQKEIENNGVLLLAPTGKARVRMEEVSKNLKVTAKTIAQFLSAFNRFDGATQRYIFSSQHCEAKYETVILDEASMLTEEMLATTLDCLKGVKRFILVGDHRQLPPIGAGRPFVDIIHYLKPENIQNAFPKMGKGYAELTIKRRQGGMKREDLQLAEWFGGEDLEVGADSIVNQILTQPNSTYLRVEQWRNESDFDKLFNKVLVEELELEDIEDKHKFNRSLGSQDGKRFAFNNAVNRVERWQILSPVKENLFGVKALNRKIHKLFKKDTVNQAKKKDNKLIPAPVGLEEIVYGDKVINVYNQKRKPQSVFPTENALNYIANGEIGIVTGQLNEPSNNPEKIPQYTQVEFSSQKGFKYSFNAGEFGDEGSPLELAYALTVHKAQGSEFGKVFLIVPNPCLLLTREMLYTALTRQKERVIVLYQGDIFDIKALASATKSDTLQRITNLFAKPELVEVEGKYLEKNLIHQASNGQMLRSKSELLIYQRLVDKNLNPLYEKKLIIKEVEKLPDFTIESEDTGMICYWEHCGMLYDDEYKQRWEEKYAWYRQNDILPFEEGGGKNGTLIITEDRAREMEDGSIRGAISVKEIDEIILKVFNQ